METPGSPLWEPPGLPGTAFLGNPIQNPGLRLLEPLWSLIALMDLISAL